MLHTKNLSIGRPSQKLDDKQIRPFQISNIVGKQAYTLQLPPAWCHIHPTYHVTLLKPWKGMNHLHNQLGPVNDNEEYTVEQVLADKQVQNKWKYLVKWQGWPDTDATWELEEHLVDSTALDDYQSKYTKAPATAQPTQCSAQRK